MFHVTYLIGMTKNRASSGAKLSSLTIVILDGPAPVKDVFKLDEHVTNLECRVDDTPQIWDEVPGVSGRGFGKVA